MKLYILKENFDYKQMEHFMNAYKRRFPSFPMSRQEEYNFHQNIKKLLSMDFPKGSIAVKFLTVKPNPEIHNIVNFKGSRTIKYTNNVDRPFYGNEFWAIVKNSNFVTLLIRANYLTKNNEDAKKMFRVNHIVRI